MISGYVLFLIQETSCGKVNLHYGIPNELFVCDDHDFENAK